MNHHNFYNCLFLWKPKTCLKGTVARDILPRIFLSWIDRIPRPKIYLKLRTWSCVHQKKLRLRSCGLVVAEQHFFKKLRNCDCGSAFFKLRNCDCGLKKKLRVPTSVWGTPSLPEVQNLCYCTFCICFLAISVKLIIHVCTWLTSWDRTWIGRAGLTFWDRTCVGVAGALSSRTEPVLMSQYSIP